MRSPAERADALKNLCWILLVKEIYGLEDVMGLEMERRGLASAEEVGDVLHLDEGHC